MNYSLKEKADKYGIFKVQREKTPYRNLQVNMRALIITSRKLEFNNMVLNIGLIEYDF